MFGQRSKNLSFLLLAPLLGTCSQTPSVLDQVLKLGELRVITRNSATTYYDGPEGPLGLEYDLAKLFADELGVRLNIYAAPSFADIIPAVLNGNAHFAAAGLSVTEPRREYLRFTPSYQEVEQQLVYRFGAKRPKDLGEIEADQLQVVAHSSHAEQLRKLQHDYQTLEWSEDPHADAGELLSRLINREIDYTVADSNEVAISRFHYPEMRVAFELGAPEPIAWAFRQGQQDDSLYRRTLPFFYKLHRSGKLERLIDRYYGHTGRFDYVGTRRFLRHIDSRLPTYIESYKDAEAVTGIDWRLLAAIGYQESHWNPSAVSPTGVRGIMMLTKATARQLGIEDRNDPVQSITGGARYFLRIKERIPDRITEPDRSWFALASYNVGFGHMEDARVLTERDTEDPDRWTDVRQYLPLLSQKKWYSQLRHGYARGWEPVQYVDNIRRYYQILQWAMSERYRPWVRKDDAPDKEEPKVDDETELVNA